MLSKRTQQQIDFDYTKHGWAFCNKAMLEGKLKRLQELANDLSPEDPRHRILEEMELTYLSL